MKGHQKSIKFIKLSQNQQQLYSVCNDSTFKIWDISQKVLLNEFKVEGSSITCITTNDFIEDKIFIGFKNGTIK